MNICIPPACMLLLCACSEPVKNEFKEEFTQSLRTGFVRSVTEAYVERATGKSLFDSATIEEIYRYVGEETIDKVSPEEATLLLSDSNTMSDELKEHIKDVGTACTKEALGMAESKTR